ncbi:hypothetical protein LCGC14_2884380, partial [marine sediment metagenome]
SDGTNLLYGCSATQTKAYTDSTPIVSEKSSANRTLHVEYPPTITINKPVDGAWNTSRTVELSWTVATKWDSGTTILTRLWTNESDGVWAPATGTIEVTNNTAKIQTYYFNELSDITWGIKATQYNDANVFNFSVNRTIRIDATDPVIDVSSPENNTIQNSRTITISYTATDENLNKINIYIDDFSQVNFTNVSVISAITSYQTDINSTMPDGVFNFSVEGNDSSGRAVSSPNFTITIDIRNSSITGFCDKRRLNWTTNESTNHTIYIDTDTQVTDGTIGENSTFSTSHSFDFDFGFNAEILYYLNITSCDQAGNCNTSGQQTFQTPARVCSGWSQYAIYDTVVNLTIIQNQTGADLIYVWNATNQEWIFHTAGLTTNDGVEIGFDTAYH